MIIIIIIIKLRNHSPLHNSLIIYNSYLYGVRIHRYKSACLT